MKWYLNRGPSVEGNRSGIREHIPPLTTLPLSPHSYVFPTMQMIAEDLIAVLDQLKVNLVIGLGEGAGANILARFGMAYPDRCMGLILIHCTSTTAGVMEHFKDKVRREVEVGYCWNRRGRKDIETR